MSTPVHPVRQFAQPRGFTLLELLVALVAAAVLMGALVTTLSAAFRLQAQSHRNELAELPRTEALQRLRQQLLAAVPPNGVIAGPLQSTPSTSGSNRHDDVQWVTAVGATNPDALGGDLVAVHYYVAETTTPDHFQLRRTEVTNPLVTTTTAPDEIAVLDDVAVFMCTWYDGTTWQDTWDTTAQQGALPQAAKVHIEFAAVDGFTAPPLDLLVPLGVQSLTALAASATATSTTGATTP